ncbi:MAG TPA: M48 family metalloprotease [Methylomirabilota bacterium]|nr:M48 family metalloprotease [Methylomirabilota bacterium]
MLSPRLSASLRGIAGLIALAGAGCAVNPVSGWPEFTLVSVEQERRLGEEEAKKVEAQMGVLEDAALTGYLEALGQRLARESPRQDVTHRFRILDMAEPNAFALPGGPVYVSRGLLALVNAEDELAGVVGHEVGHVAARHSVQTISRQGPVAVLFGVASGITGLILPTVGDIIGGIGDFTQSLVFAPYGRGQETEADRVGQEIAARAGWDPAGLSAFLTTLGREVDLQSKGPRRPSFFDTHPTTPDRVARTTTHARELTRATQLPLSATREAFLARFDGLVVGPRAADGLIVGRTFVHPDLDVFMQFPEKWAVENTPRRVVAVAPDQETAVLFRAVATGDDPLEGARLVEKALKTPVVATTQTLKINGLPAAHTQLEVEGKVGVDLTWIAHRKVVYQVAGLASKQRFATVQPLFATVARSFRPLTAAERAGVKENRLRLVTARAGETIEALALRVKSAWTREEVAIANGLAVADRLREGQLIKVALAEAYPSAPGR